MYTQPPPTRGGHHSSFTELPAEPRSSLRIALGTALSDWPEGVLRTPSVGALPGLQGVLQRNQKEGHEHTVKSTQAFVIIVYFLNTATKKDGKNMVLSLSELLFLRWGWGNMMFK